MSRFASLKPNVLQFIKFGIVGVTNTFVSYALYIAFLFLFQKHGFIPRYDYIVAHFVSFLLSVLWSFHWNRKFVFTGDSEVVPWLSALIKTYASYAFTGIILNSALLFIWVHVLNVPKLYAPIFSLMISVPINFVLNKYWAFQKSRNKKD